MRRSLFSGLLLAGVCVSVPGAAAAVSAAAAHGREWTFVGVVLKIAPGLEGQPLIPVGFDPRFRVTLAIQEWRGETGPWAVGAQPVFAVHSPTLLFGEPEATTRALFGATYLFRLRGDTSLSHFSALTVVERIAPPPDPVPPTVALGHAPAINEELPPGGRVSRVLHPGRAAGEGLESSMKVVGRSSYGKCRLNSESRVALGAGGGLWRQPSEAVTVGPGEPACYGFLARSVNEWRTT